MRAVVHPSRIGGEWRPARYSPPPSKSHFQRVCAAALLHRGTTIITNPGRSADDAAAVRIIESLGAEVDLLDDFIAVTSNGKVRPRTGAIHCGESGLAARVFAPIAALANAPVEIRGVGSLLSRPMDGVVDALRRLGVSVTGSRGTLPFTVEGPIAAKSLLVDGSVSSQIISGLLFALAAAARGPIMLDAPGLVSAPYVAMSCAVLQHFGRAVYFDGYGTCTITPSAPPTDAMDVAIEADWSSIAPMAVAAAFAGELLMDYQPAPHQADASILQILRKAGAAVHVDEDVGVCNIGPAPLYAFEADCTHSPDLVPILAVLGSACEGRSRISGLHRLTHKESNRARTTSILLIQLGIRHSVEGNVLFVGGTTTPKSATVDGHNDHRIVMAAAVAALRADGPVTIEGAEAVRKSYPAFFEDLQSLGARVDLIA